MKTKKKKVKKAKIKKRPKSPKEVRENNLRRRLKHMRAEVARLEGKAKAAYIRFAHFPISHKQWKKRSDAHDAAQIELKEAKAEVVRLCDLLGYIIN